MRELVLQVELVHYRRECWVTPAGKTVLAPLPASIVGGYGPNLRRFCLKLHAQGQVTTERLTTLVNDVGGETAAETPRRQNSPGYPYLVTGADLVAEMRPDADRL